LETRKIRYTSGKTPLIAIPQVYLDELKVERGATMAVELGKNCIIVKPMGVAVQQDNSEFDTDVSMNQSQSSESPRQKTVYIPSWVKDGEALHEQEKLSGDTVRPDTPASDAGETDDRPDASDGTGELNSGSGDPGTPTGE